MQVVKPKNINMGQRFNISAAYDLAESALSAIQGRYGEQYLEDFLDLDKLENNRKLVTPRKKTLLHVFLQNWEDVRWDDTLHAVGISGCFDDILLYLKVCQIDRPPRLTKNNAAHREKTIYGLLESAVPKAANAAFNLLFQDLEFLNLFQLLIANARRQLGEKNNLKRAKYIPKWLAQGVFYRDKGRCRHCGKDVSGTLNIENKLHLDHLLPLNIGGCNDPTNFQLLCKECNLSKGKTKDKPRNANQGFW